MSVMTRNSMFKALVNTAELGMADSSNTHICISDLLEVVIVDATVDLQVNSITHVYAQIICSTTSTIAIDCFLYHVIGSERSNYSDQRPSNGTL